jgi:hypothetical protein
MSKPTDVPSGSAISIRQPYVEEILLGKKKFEYRNQKTHKRGRVYLYAAKGAGDLARYKKLGVEPGDLPVGVIVGSVEVVDCIYFEDENLYGYKLKNPRRYRKHLTPRNRPQPVWFFPFGK